MTQVQRAAGRWPCAFLLSPAACCCCACSKLLELAQQLVELDTKLKHLISPGGDASPSASRQHSTDRMSTIAQQTDSASIAASVCLQLGELLGLQRSYAYRMGAAAGVVINTGQAMLEMLLNAVKFHPQLDDPPFLSTLHDCAKTQMDAVGVLLHVDMQQQAVAALAASVARPQVLLQWLSTLTESLMLTCQTELTGKHCRCKQR